MDKYNIAIDGVAAAGKGTYSKPLAEILGYQLLDAGSMYRAASAFFLNKEIIPEIVGEHLGLITELDFDGINPYVNGELFDEKMIRNDLIDRITPEYGRNVGFKKMIIQFQNQITSKSKGWVGEGRNIAFEVMNGNRDLSLYLWANPMVRALRRLNDRKAPDWELPTYFAEIQKRDETDFRHYPPLMKPEEAKENYDYFVDTTKGNIAENFLKIVNVVRTALPNIKIEEPKLEKILTSM